MNATSIDIKDILLAESSTIGLDFAVNLFIGREPPLPNDCVTIFDTTSFPPSLSLDSSTYEYPSVQIRVRSSSYGTGWELAQNIADLLHGRAQETWNSSLYSIIRVGSGPAFLDWDENNRARFIININTQRRNSQ